VSDNLDPRGDDSLREVETEARRLASDARDARAENERGTQRGQETDYAFRLPPDVAHADRVRSGDDVELMDRQAQAAEAQRQAAETLRQNAERLQGTARQLDHASEAVRDNRDDVRDVQQNAEELRAQTDRAREMVARAEIPDVDGGDGNSDRGGRES
jgi:DNA repair exonuclease SbcCD ATPase subunit